MDQDNAAPPSVSVSWIDVPFSNLVVFMWKLVFAFLLVSALIAAAVGLIYWFLMDFQA